MAKGHENVISIQSKSVQNPTAHNATLCADRTKLNPLVSHALALIHDSHSWPESFRVIIDIQLRLGLRISEVLKLVPADLLPLGRIRIRSSKRGKDRILNYSDPFNYLEKCRQLSLLPFRDYNRFYVYREYKKFGIMLYLGDHKKYSVTHLFRHLFATSLDQVVDDRSLISDALGHKSRKSIESYVKPK